MRKRQQRSWIRNSFRFFIRITLELGNVNEEGKFFDVKRKRNVCDLLDFRLLCGKLYHIRQMIRGNEYDLLDEARRGSV